MKFGVRKPSWKKSLSARASFKRVLRHSLGLKAPRGWGWLTNPKKACYNRIYSRTTISFASLFESLFKPKSKAVVDNKVTYSPTAIMNPIADEKTELILKMAFILKQKQNKEITKIIQLLQKNIEMDQMEALRLMQEIEKEKIEQLKITVKPIIETFASQIINEECYPIGLSFAYDAIKALSMLINDKLGLDISLDVLQEFVDEEITAKNLIIYERFFFKDNPEIINNYYLQAWINAYINTFGNNFDYDYYFKILLKRKEIDLYSEEITADEITELYRINNIEMIEEETDKIFMETFIKNQVNKIQSKEYEYWGNYYLQCHFNKAINKIRLRNLADSFKQNMHTGKKLGEEDLTIERIDIMSGIEFEHFLNDLFSKDGYKTEITKASGDQGADLIVEKFGERTVVQAKRYSNAVSNSAIQEVVAAKAHYNCSRTIVITNNYFTKSAIELAYSNKVELCDREMLKSKLEEYNLKVSKCL